MSSASSLVLLTLARLRLAFREPGVLFWTFGFPILITVALGIAFRSRPPDPVVAAVQQGPGSAPLLAALSTDRRQVRVLRMEARQAQEALRVGRVAVVVVPGPSPRYLLDPTRPESRLARLVVDDALQRAAGRREALAVRDEHLVAPGSRYVDFLLPGLIGLNIMSSGMWGVGYAIVETRTRGLLKRLVATPMKRRHYLLSFVLMRMLMLALELPVLLLFGWLAFGIAVRGSLVLLVAIAVLGALAFSGIGLLLASRAQNTHTVSGLMNLVMMPMYIGSGVFFSATRFPDVMQPVVRALPLTALNDALRAVMNEGAGPAAVGLPCLLLLGVALASFTVALRIFRWN